MAAVHGGSGAVDHVVTVVVASAAGVIAVVCVCVASVVIAVPVGVVRAVILVVGGDGVVCY